ncbi:zinc-finger of the MIZ type in Nse subunit-domain-containing protein [Tuber brumale]|nr:zinc-finger of the MIZ type in Nse subunit-domain-containing protein [Tuber brumale]
MSDRTSHVAIPAYETPLLPLTAKEIQSLTTLINTRSGIAKVSDTIASAITVLGNATLELYPDPEEENEEKEKAMADMEKLARELVDENKRALDMKEALESIVRVQREALLRGDEPRESGEEQGLSGQYESTLVAKKRHWDAMSNTEKYTTSPEYLDFRRSHWEARNPEVPLPPTRTWFSSGASGAQDDESDIEIAQEKQSYKCPLTLRPFEDPVRSTVCPHAFEKDAIEDMIKRSPVKGVPCPTPGCTKMLTLKVLKRDSVLKRKVARALALEKRNRQMQEDESEEEKAEEEGSEEEEAQPGPSSRRGKSKAELRKVKVEKRGKKFQGSKRPVAVSSEEEDGEDDVDAMDEEED